VGLAIISKLGGGVDDSVLWLSFAQQKVFLQLILYPNVAQSLFSFYGLKMFVFLVCVCFCLVFLLLHPELDFKASKVTIDCGCTFRGQPWGQSYDF
jgi:hypothetical protein